MSSKAISPKVRVPAIVGQVIAGVLAVLAVAGTIPAYAPITAEVISVIHVITGYLTYDA